MTHFVNTHQLAQPSFYAPGAPPNNSGQTRSLTSLIFAATASLHDMILLSSSGAAIDAFTCLWSGEAAGGGGRRASSLGRLRQPAPPNLPGCPGLQGRDRTAAV
eukprot:COSAG01_NODE_6982_length_3405_cov_2.719601_6_plen_103_part_01